MKIINEKGKLFGIINVVDLLVLVAAIVVVAGVGYKLFAKQIKEVASPQVSLTMTVRVRGATPFLVNEVQRNSQVGKSLVNGNSYVNAQITDMKIDDYNQQVTTADGRIVTATDSGEEGSGIHHHDQGFQGHTCTGHRYAGGARRPYIHCKDQRF